MNRGLFVIGLAMLAGGANCARETVSCPEGTAIVDFQNGGRECVPVGPDGGLGGTGGILLQAAGWSALGSAWQTARAKSRLAAR